MSSRSHKLYIQDILQACDDISNFTQAMKESAELQNDRRTFLAVVHSLEIIGEAARQTPKSFREKHSEIPWREPACGTLSLMSVFKVPRRILMTVIGIQTCSSPVNPGSMYSAPIITRMDNTAATAWIGLQACLTARIVSIS